MAANRDRILVAILTSDSILIWYAKPCVPIISHRRSPQSVAELGDKGVTVGVIGNERVSVGVVRFIEKRGKQRILRLENVLGFMR